MAEECTNTAPAIAVVDDDEAARISLAQMLRLRRYRVEAFSSAEAVLAWPELPGADCVISDIKMPGMDGEQFLSEMLRRRIPGPVILITGHGDVSMAVRCLKNGAYDFVEKPFEEDVLLASVSRAVEKTALRRESEALRRRLEAFSPQENGHLGMIGRSRVMLDLYAQVETVAPSPAPVLIRGETGTGKELVARAIHSRGPNPNGPLIAVNAGALPESMLESELFGHAKGAFTGADSARDGKLLTASGGTLLLDEVESLSLRAQVGLLRVLEDGLVQPVGSDEQRETDIRLLATAKVDLVAEVKAGRMREDFYHRIAVLTVDVPPLRDRPEDMPLLLGAFLRSAAERNGTSVPRVPEEMLASLQREYWPGNVRQLRNAAERMVITARDGEAGPFRAEEAEGGNRLLSLPPGPGRLADELQRTERAVIESALRENQGEVGITAQALGISRRALYDRMKKYALDRQNYRI